MSAIAALSSRAPRPHDQALTPASVSCFASRARIFLSLVLLCYLLCSSGSDYLGCWVERCK